MHVAIFFLVLIVAIVIAPIIVMKTYHLYYNAQIVREKEKQEIREQKEYFYQQTEHVFGNRYSPKDVNVFLDRAEHNGDMTTIRACNHLLSLWPQE